MRPFVFGLIIGALLLAFGVYSYFTSGHAPAAVEDKPIPFERQLANGALHAHIEKEMPRSTPVAASEGTYLAGAPIYVQHCGICHGYPGVDQSPMAKAMFPKPPHLFHGKGVTDDPAGETYWKVANGIRLTGMPEFRHILSDTEMWQVSLLLANADKISDMVKLRLQPPPMPGAQGTGGQPSSGTSKPSAPPTR